MNKDVFWDRIETVNAGMLDLDDGARWVPMSHHADREAGRLWFLSAVGTQLADAVAIAPKAARYIVADNAGGVFAQVSGSLAQSHDRAKLEELWNPVAAAWFQGGIDDPDLRMLCFTVSGGEVWVTPTSGLRFMFSVAKARLTGDDPDMGDHFTL